MRYTEEWHPQVGDRVWTPVNSKKLNGKYLKGRVVEVVDKEYVLTKCRTGTHRDKIEHLLFRRTAHRSPLESILYHLF